MFTVLQQEFPNPTFILLLKAVFMATTSAAMQLLLISNLKWNDNVLAEFFS